MIRRRGDLEKNGLVGFSGGYISYRRLWVLVALLCACSAKPPRGDAVDQDPNNFYVLYNQETGLRFEFSWVKANENKKKYDLTYLEINPQKIQKVRSKPGVRLYIDLSVINPARYHYQIWESYQLKPKLATKREVQNKLYDGYDRSVKIRARCPIEADAVVRYALVIRDSQGAVITYLGDVAYRVK